MKKSIYSLVVCLLASVSCFAQYSTTYYDQVNSMPAFSSEILYEK